MLKEVIDKYYLDKKKSREQTSFYISEAGKCPRQIFFKFKGVPAKEKKAHILRLFDHGDHMHQLIMNSLFGARDIRVVSAEVDIPPQEIVRGRADAIISDRDKLYVLDIKSMNSMIFRSLKDPKPENIDQVQLYLHYFKISKGILLYVDKNSLELKEFLIDYDKKRATGLVETLKNLQEKINSGIVPSRITDYPEDWQCRFCDFKVFCDKGKAEDMKWDKFKELIQLA